MLYALTEAQNYLAMFNDFIKTNPRDREVIDRYIKWARTTLKKNDRIIWFLRFVRVELAGGLRNNNAEAELAKVNAKLQTHFTQQDLLPINNLMNQLAHYLTMQVPAIEAVVWLKQSPLELTDEFATLEEEHKQTADDDAGALEMYRAGRLIPRNPSDQIIIQCPDGMSWVDLQKGGCSVEGRAMGHCGNGYGRNGENVLSLRRPVKMDGQEFWYPVVTFIIDRNNMAGEMKGRGNEKPAARYHNDIVLLLRSQYVDGIKGGGYKPENNFSLDDLDPDLAAALVAEKPMLAGLYETWKKRGMTPEVRRMLDESLYSAGIETPEKFIPASADEAGQFVLDSWLEFDNFLGQIDDADRLKLYHIATGENDDESLEPIDAFAAMLETLPPAWQDEALKRAGLAESTDAHRIAYAARKLNQQNDEWYDVFSEIVAQGQHRRDTAWERLNDYAKVGWYFSSSYAYLNIPRDEPLREWLVNNPVIELLIGERDLANIATADSDDDEYGYDKYKIARNGWASLEEDYDLSHWREAGLINDRGDDKWLAQETADDDSDVEMGHRFMSAVRMGNTSTTIHDPRQHSLNFESVDRLRKLAGL